VNRYMKLFFRFALPFLCLPVFAQSEWKALFNGKDLTGWDTVIQKQKVNEDPDGHVTVHDGAIHMYQNVQDETEVVPFGVIMTKDSFSKFHLSFEYRWVGKRFRPRMRRLRDAGLLYHCFGKQKVWPDSIECQVQEGDTGDLVFLGSSALTWVHSEPAVARPGQGQAGQLPEYSGVLKTYPGGGYVGRFPENCNNKGWNTVEAIVHENEYAMHKINGAVTSRVLDMQDKKGNSLTSGPIALQLEAAEIQYRNVKIKELDGYLRPSTYQVAMSRVGSLRSQHQKFTITNTSKGALDLTPLITGRHVGAFEINTDDITPLAAGQSREFEVSFHPDMGSGNYSAGIQFGADDTGCFVQLSAIATPALEGKNEPTLHHITQALGASVDVGGKALSLDTKKAVIGESVQAGGFALVKGGGFEGDPTRSFFP